ncbi:MAG: 3-dehydroquinate synthase [Actinobacteria bacterium]|nr:3-dehydroquinate synthase [Actinomycetota bacterium]
MDRVHGTGDMSGAMKLLRVQVHHERGVYDVWIGSGARHILAGVVPAHVRRAAIVTQENITVDIDPGVESKVFYIDQGESTKSLTSLERLCSEFARWGMHRDDLVIAVGGGVTTDLAGFAAAVYHRGIRLVNVPTTLIAQVDAAIGGKTGVNLPQGKNLVGAFWQPSAVLCDIDLLTTLPRREWVNGLAEVAKYVFLGAEDILPGPGETWEQGLENRIARCVEVKADIVAADERDSWRRMVLNYGHTLGHALEAAAFERHRSWDLRHGEAVSIGMMFAAKLAARLGRIKEDRIQFHGEVLSSCGLPIALPSDADPTELVMFMESDKKAIDSLTLVLDGPNGPEPVRGIDVAEVIATLEDMLLSSVPHSRLTGKE